MGVVTAGCNQLLLDGASVCVDALLSETLMRFIRRGWGLQERTEVVEGGIKGH